MPSAALIACPHCKAVARHDRVRVTNPVQMSSHRKRAEHDHAQCHACQQRYALASAEVVAQMELHRAGLPLADVILIEAGPQAKIVRAKIELMRLEFNEPMVVAADISIESARGMALAFTGLGATMEVRPIERDPRWDSAARVQLTE